MRFDQDRNAAVSNRKREVLVIQRFAKPLTKGIARTGIAAFLLFVGTASASAENVADVILGSGSFQIPFNIANNGNAPREVELYMASTGDEASGQWRLLDRQPPGAGKFQLSETPDGTFWFATRTIDASGRAHPPGPIEPELKVIVDTGQPVVHLAAEASAEGKVVAEFTVDDASGADQMTVHYVTDTKPQWQTANILPTAQGGKFQFEPTDNWQQLSLRVRVLDRAGNETIVKKRVHKPRVAVAGTTRLASGPLGFGPSGFNNSGFNNPFNASGNAPNASTQIPSAQIPSTLVPGTQVPTTQPPYGITATPPAGIRPSPPVGALASSDAALPPPSTAQQISDDFGMPEIEMLPGQASARGNSTEDLPVPMGQLEERPKTAAEAMRPLIPEGPGSPLPQQIQPAQNQPTLAAPQNKPDTPSGSLAPQTPFQTEVVPAPYGQPPAPNRLNRPALETRSLDQNDAEGTAAPSPWSPIDPMRSRNPSRSFSRETPPSGSGQRQVQARPSIDETRSNPDRLDLDQLAKRSVVRHSDSRQFSLDYEIEAIGGRGVEAIELYGTTDGGQSWKRWGDDPDRISPFDIETNGEGIFGFNIVVVAENGLASPRPLPGDVPDIVVVVDETKPEVSITGARYGEADRAGSLVMQYRCEDEYLMSRPIALAFSESPDGPWTTIAAGLRNLGDYVWPADPQLPRQIYLRIDATDQAGNVGGFVLEEPIDTRGLAPRARIRAFRSIPTR